jgi:glycerophosphoryl diester phosphodiesterase
MYDIAALLSYSLQTLTYHETNPDHHLQTIIGLSDSLPLLSTIFYSNAASEGWARYAEIDVQTASDGTLMVLHDADLMRIAGDPRRVANLSASEMQQLDAGSWHSAAFAGESVPTLLEMLNEARNNIGLNKANTQFLAVNQSITHEKFIARAHKGGKQVHVWTVNNPRQMLRMLALGADVLITDYPQEAVEIRAQWLALSC